MALIRKITVTVLLSSMLVATAAGSFVYLVSSYPSPEVQSFSVTSNQTERGLNISTSSEIRNLGGEGEVRVEIRMLEEDGSVSDSIGREFYMARSETRIVREQFSGESIQNVGLAVFAPGRPDIIRDESELLERIPRP
ncbi:MAG: hypothetical protein V5A72_03460 [Candidatus Nanohaloarchaea archaeon]